MKLIQIIIALLYLPVCSDAQTDSLTKEIITKTCAASSSLTNPGLTLRFYDIIQYRTAWVQRPAIETQLINIFRNAEQYGLNSRAYKYQTDHPGNTTYLNTTDSIEHDIKLTDIIISFLRDFLYGSPPTVGYAGLDIKQDCTDIPALLSGGIINMHFDEWLKSIEIKNTGYQSLKKEIIRFALSPDSNDLNKQQALFRAINTFRWLHCLQKKEKLIVVNIPSATLNVLLNDSMLLASNVIVGKRSTPTPTLMSEVTQIVLYPYWMVPHKIASRELLPLIKKNPGYLTQNNFQVLDHAGRITDVATINWNELSKNNFPYTLRQSTGCDNSLGLIKLEFYSPYSVYLHDTPWKILFLSPQRFFSHGCIRVEKAKELAKLLLDENTMAIDTLITDNPPAVHKSVYVKLPSPVPVLVLYNTAWPDSSGVVHYFRDIYNKLN